MLSVRLDGGPPKHWHLAQPASFLVPFGNLKIVDLILYMILDSRSILLNILMFMNVLGVGMTIPDFSSHGFD